MLAKFLPQPWVALVVVVLSLTGVLPAQPVPVARYTFDDGTAIDFSGNQLHGTLVGSAQIISDVSRPNAPGTNRVLQLNGQSGVTGTNQSYVNLTDPNGLLNFAGGNATVAAWVRMDLTKNHNAIFSQGEWSRGASVTIKGDTSPANRLWTGHTSPNESFNSLGAVPLQQWMHVAITWTVVDEDTELTFFTNGVASGTFTMTGTLSAPVNGSAIGREWRDATPGSLRWVFNGLIDELHIFNSALRTSAIQALYTAGSTPPPSTNPPPVIAVLNPPEGFVVRTLLQAEVIFDQPVQGVSAADLLIAGSPATHVNALSATRYVFTFPQPAPGNVTFSWAAGHGITRLNDAVSVFGGGTWNVLLNPAQPSAGVVINEIHYDPEPKMERVEFVELYNDSEQTNDLSGWRFSSGITYTFPPNTLMPPNSYLLLTENLSDFAAKFGHPSLPYPVSAFGEFTGSLANEGEGVRLVNTTDQIISEVTYGIGFPWPITPNGESNSLERINPWVDGQLAGSWRGSIGTPTPGRANSMFAANAPPHLEAVTHSPQQPAAGQPITVSVKVQDVDGVSAVTLEYQTVAPGNYIPAYLAKPTSFLLTNPNDPRQPNPAYVTNWTVIPMHDDGTNGDAVAGDSVYTAVIPGQLNRALVRYRITTSDTLGATVRVPYADDPSLNFGCFIYNGVPDYVADTQSVLGAPYTYPSAIITSVPVYHLLTKSNDFAQCLAYDTADRIPVNNYDARDAYNWTGTFVYDGQVYDNVGYRLGRRNARYASYVSGAIGKRNFKFKFNAGRLPTLRDMDGNLHLQPTRTLITHNMIGSRSNPSWGLDQAANNLLWNLTGTPAAHMHWFHLRVVQGPTEAPAGFNGQYFGDFYGLLLAIEDYDSRYLDARTLEKGNIYKLMSFRTDGLDRQKYQAKDSVSDGSDFENIIFNLRPERSDAWLREHVNWDQWYRYRAILEAVRHYDMRPNTGEHLKNRFYYFQPSTNLLGKLWVLPQDSDTSWGPNFNGGVDFKKEAIYGVNGGAPRAAFIRDFKNAVREVRDLLWTPEQISLLLDPLAARIAAFVPADRDRWTGAPAAAGSQNNPALSTVVASMKQFAFTGGSWTGGNDSQIWDGAAKDSGISGLQGRGAYLDFLASDPAISATPVVNATGPTNFPLNQLAFETSAYTGGTAFAARQWRIAEVTLTNELPLAPGVHPKFEITPAWESEEITVAGERAITIPAFVTEAGKNYRVRVRTRDTAGRWSHWSAPIQFSPRAAVVPAWPLSNGPYVFTDWSVTNPAATYPPHMLFYQITNSVGDPGLTAEMDSLWTLPYNLDSRSRINGLGPDGFAFVNTGNAQEIEGAGFLGAAVLALNTDGAENIRVTWTGGTVTPNNRVYGLRLQYRVGAEGNFTDVLNAQNQPVEYLRNPSAGHTAVLGPVTLPAAANHQPQVELRWKYYFVSGSSGARAQLRVANIHVVAVAPPVLADLPNRHVHVGQTIQFTATVTNAESQPLTFTLTNSPAGALINATNGAFTWTVANVPAPGTNSVTVFVHDDGQPPLTDAQTFQVIVQPPPQLTVSPPDQGGNITLQFPSLLSQSYQLEFTDSLTPANWMPLGGPHTGTGNVITINATVSGLPQQFYQLRVGP